MLHHRHVPHGPRRQAPALGPPSGGAGLSEKASRRVRLSTAPKDGPNAARAIDGAQGFHAENERQTRERRGCQQPEQGLSLKHVEAIEQHQPKKQMQAAVCARRLSQKFERTKRGKKREKICMHVLWCGSHRARKYEADMLWWCKGLSKGNGMVRASGLRWWDCNRNDLLLEARAVSRCQLQVDDEPCRWHHRLHFYYRMSWGALAERRRRPPSLPGAALV